MPSDDQLTNEQLEASLRHELEACTPPGRRNITRLEALKAKVGRYIQACDADLAQRAAYRNLGVELQARVGTEMPASKIAKVLEPFEWMATIAREDEPEVIDLRNRMATVRADVCAALAASDS